MAIEGRRKTCQFSAYHLELALNALPHLAVHALHVLQPHFCTPAALAAASVPARAALPLLMPHDGLSTADHASAASAGARGAGDGEEKRDSVKQQKEGDTPQSMS